MASTPELCPTVARVAACAGHASVAGAHRARTSMTSGSAKCPSKAQRKNSPLSCEVPRRTHSQNCAWTGESALHGRNPVMCRTARRPTRKSSPDGVNPSPRPTRAWTRVSSVGTANACRPVPQRCQRRVGCCTGGREAHRPMLQGQQQWRQTAPRGVAAEPGSQPVRSCGPAPTGSVQAAPAPARPRRGRRHNADGALLGISWPSGYPGPRARQRVGVSPALQHQWRARAPGAPVTCPPPVRSASARQGYAH